MIQMDSAFFNIESIRVFTSTFVVLCFANSCPFTFPSRSKRPPLDILKLFITILRNHDKKVASIQVYEDRSLARSSEFMKTCHNMNIIVQNTGGDTSSLNGKSESTNKTLANTTRSLIMNSSHNKELGCFSYQYAIWISLQTDNRLCDDVPYFLWHGTKPSYKHIKIWGVIVYIINGSVTRNNPNYISQ